MKFKVKVLLSILILVFLFGYSQAKIIYIPSPSLATIQGGINYASGGDTVLVNTGTYNENIDFKGKNITVASRYLLEDDSSLIELTIINAINQPSIPAVTFRSGEGPAAILSGFTIQNSSNSLGVRCDSSSSPTITYNLIKHNNQGLVCSNSSNPLIKDNLLKDNAGEGIQCTTGSSPRIERNFISGHQFGIKYTNGTSAILRNVIIQNIQKGLSINAASPQVYNNTIANNIGDGVEIISSTEVNLINNIISSSSSGVGIRVSSSNPIIKYNDVWGNAGGDFSGTPMGVGNMFWGKNNKNTPCDEFYNISRNPEFENPPVDFQLQCSSPCINVGDPGFVIPDLGGHRIDMGAFEYPLLRGDVWVDGKLDASDVVFLVNCCFKGGPLPDPYEKGDVTANGAVDVQDIIHLINYLYRNGMPPCH
ncbi:MAG: right-handed parallel beta-helix repeat-containing protein [candidate division Zixibacteria bacterium]|nr:right-handed parallel beta-helix repeat-containing protein [candidate division Zixibacteria bacterium]